ncbi:MAG: LruC domain-containing protein [Cyclobacteriaceae bacterium]|jgi:LruC domain-containing protein
MKTQHIKNTIMKFLKLLFISLLFTGCVKEFTGKEEVIAPIDINNSFDFNTISEEEISIQLNTANGEPMQNVLVIFHTNESNASDEVFLKLITDNNGHASTSYSLPLALESAIVEIPRLGFPQFTEVTTAELVNGLVYKGHEHAYREVDITSTNANRNSNSNRQMSIYNIHTLGTFNSQGVPDYLETSDIISAELLEFISVSLPESKPVPTYHPGFLTENSQTNLDILAPADVWITFVHEGAGYKNILGFYTYTTGTPPTSTSDITDITIAFPNVSYAGSGGGLMSGDKVKIGQFDPGVSIGFILLANGWNGNITNGLRQVYSHEGLNPESDPELQQHNVLLFDEINELFLLGFEDLNRMEGSDDDFNDAVFYITSNPLEAISIENINPIDQPTDTDGDGVSDIYDEYPNDIELAYGYSYPGEDSYGTFAFEDNWPGYGDYDFNDLVIDYQYIQLANAENKISRLQGKFIVKAVGAGFSNGFGIQLDLSSNLVTEVVGSQLHGDLFSVNAAGVENNQTKAIIPVTDAAHYNFNTRGFVNTDPSFEYLTPDTIIVEVKFSRPLGLSEGGAAPFNPFIVINQTRGREAHLPGYSPTDLVDDSYFGTGNDDSKPNLNSYYKSQTGLPWGMNLPVSFTYPKEKVSILNSYNHFSQWTQSLGFSYMDWYSNKTGYRNDDQLFQK